MPNTYDNDNFVYELLKEDFYNEYNRLGILEGKASNLLAVAGIILTFQGGLPLLSQNNYFSNWSIFHFILYILPLILYAISIIFFLKAFSTSDYNYIPDTEKSELYECKNDKKELKFLLIEHYKKEFEKNNKILENKGKNIDHGVYLFIGGILLTLIYLSCTILNIQGII